MKTKNYLLLLMATLLFYGCESPSYLSSINQIEDNSHGASILVYLQPHGIMKGELLAIDSNDLSILQYSYDERVMTAAIIPINRIRNFEIQYAKPKNYGWSIPLLTLSTISHGWYLIFTLPLNLIVTISTTAGSQNSFMYNKKEISLNELKMFARFPQGLPKGIDINYFNNQP
jgi:hypothetical protein